MKQADGFEIVALLDEGLPGSRIDPLIEHLGISVKEMAEVLDVAERTLHRFRSANRLDRATAERVVLLEQLVTHGLDVFDNRPPVFERWLRTPLGELNHLPSLRYLTSTTGIRLVDDVLSRIEYGVYV